MTEPKIVGTEALESKVYVTRALRKGAEDVAEDSGEEVIGVHRFVTTPAQVKFGLGLTVNLGNYESARIDVAVTVPCYAEEIQDAYEMATKWCAERIVQEKNEVREWARARAKDMGF